MAETNDKSANTYVEQFASTVRNLAATIDDDNDRRAYLNTVSEIIKTLRDNKLDEATTNKILLAKDDELANWLLLKTLSNLCAKRADEVLQSFGNRDPLETDNLDD